MQPSLRVATMQFQHRAGDKAFNLAAITRLSRSALAGGADLAVFPEMCVCGYGHISGLDQDALLASSEPENGSSVSAVAALAAELKIGIGVGWLEKDGDRFFNSYRLCFPDGSGHTHRKLHAFEHPSISTGGTFTVFDTAWGVRVAILICWDNNLIENARVCALKGAQLLLAPHQTGGTRSISPFGMKPIPLALWHDREKSPSALRAAFQGPNGREWLLRWLPARAHDNGLFVVFANGVGADADEVRTGHAMVLDPYGRIVAESDAIGDDVVFADLDLSLIDTSSGRRWMRGRRPELYGILGEYLGNEQSPRETRFGVSGPPWDRSRSDRDAVRSD